MLEVATRVRPERATDESPGPGRSRPWLVGFAILHLICQLLLLVPALSGVRVVLRMVAFGMSVAFLVVIPRGHTQRTTLRTCAVCILVLLGLELFHPEGAGLVAAIAAIALNLAMLAPIFWVPRTGTTTANLQALVTVLWLFYMLSAVLGVLQAYYPGRFQPPLSAVLATNNSREALAGLEIELASGERTFRPMGLTDSPGGAAIGGIYAVLFGTGMLLSAKPPFRGARVLAVGSMLAGMMCLYLCQIRSLLVMAGVCVLTLLLILLGTGRISRLFGLLAVSGVIVPGAFAMALAIGGQSMTARLSTLVDQDPGSVYYSNRGHFLETTLTEYLPRYPLGAGLGRWGMVNAYFGSAVDALWVEIQWTGWLFDGGVAMVLLYSSAIFMASWGCLRVARGQMGTGEQSLSLWAAVIVAYDVGAVALCFNYPLFAATSGVEFWLLNMAVLCAAQQDERMALSSKPA